MNSNRSITIETFPVDILPGSPMTRLREGSAPTVEATIGYRKGRGYVLRFDFYEEDPDGFRTSLLVGTPPWHTSEVLDNAPRFNAKRLAAEADHMTELPGYQDLLAAFLAARGLARAASTASTEGGAS